MLILYLSYFITTVTSLQFWYNYLILSWLVLVEIKCTVHVVLPKRPINQFKPVQQNKRQALRANCPNIQSIYCAQNFFLKRNEKNNFLFLPRNIVYAKLFSTGKFLNESSQFNTILSNMYILSTKQEVPQPTTKKKKKTKNRNVHHIKKKQFKTARYIEFQRC